MTINVTPLISTVPLNELTEAVDNVRTVFHDDTIHELATSIAENGLLNPLTVVSNGENGWTVIAGNRRLRALQSLAADGKLKKNAPINVIVSEACQATIIATMLVENLQREDISPIDEAKGYLRLADEYKFKQKDIAAKVGKAASHITKRLALLRLPEAAQAAVAAGSVSLDVAYDLTRITDPKQFESLCEQAVKNQLQSYSLSSALRNQERLEDAAKLSKWLDAHQIAATNVRPTMSEVELVGTYSAANVKDFVPARNQIVHRASDSDDRIVVYRKLTPKQVEAKQAEQEREVAVAQEAMTPLEKWQQANDENEEAYTEAMFAWQERCDQFAAEAVMSMAPKEVSKIALELIVQEAMNHTNAYRILDFMGWVPDGDTTPSYNGVHWRQVLTSLIDGSTAKAIQVWVLNRALVSPLPNVSSHLDQIGQEAAAAAGLVEPTLPAMPPEPWQDADGNWVTDRPYEPEHVAVDDDPAPDYEDESQAEDHEAA
jgi:ParB/RepB/Spo0J family partition protein